MQIIDHIQKLIGGLQNKISAQNIFLVETSGQILCMASPQKEGVQALAALIVGVSSAAKQLGDFIGDDSQPLIVREGKNCQLLSSFISNDVILAALVKSEEKMGYVKFKVKQYKPVLKVLIDRWKHERQEFTNPLKDVTEAEIDTFLRF